MFYLIIGIILFDYVLERTLAFLNDRNMSAELPPILEGIYDKEKYRKSQEYEKVNNRFSFITSTFSLVVMLGMLFGGGFAILDSYVRSITEQPILMTLLFFGIIGLASDLIGIPFDLYDTFVIEEKFGFNRTTVKTYILDKLKGYLLGLMIGAPLLSVFVWFYQSAGQNFWIYCWIVSSLFSIFMVMFYSSIIVPLFNKQTPLEEGALRAAIEEYARKAGFALDNIFIIDGSKRSSKANAYFSGLGSRKRIVLYDTLIKDHSIEELVAILAHEIGHYKKKHTLAGIVLSVAQTGLMLYLLSLFINSPALANALGVAQPSFHIGILAFGMLYSPIGTILGIGMNIISRMNEYAADRFATETYSGSALQEALKKLSVNNLSNLLPHPLYVFFHYSHPTLLQRLNAIDQVISNA